VFGIRARNLLLKKGIIVARVIPACDDGPGIINLHRTVDLPGRKSIDCPVPPCIGKPRNLEFSFSPRGVRMEHLQRPRSVSSELATRVYIFLGDTPGTICVGLGSRQPLPLGLQDAKGLHRPVMPGYLETRLVDGDMAGDSSEAIWSGGNEGAWLSANRAVSQINHDEGLV